MQSFLEKVAQNIYENYGSKTSELCVVLPNRRAGLFLKKYLAENYSKPIWTPEIFSIEDFVFELTGYQIIDPVYLQFDLYKVYQKLEKEKAKSFSEFINFGQVILSDFNDIDLYMVDASSIYSNLSESKALKLWNLDGQPLTEFEKYYLNFYASLGSVYSELIPLLLEKKQVYQGLAYKRLAEELRNDQFDIKWKNVLFAGFNALTTAEIQIISSLKKRGIAHLVWDVDTYYLNNTIQEAGHFLRENAKWLQTKELKWVSDCFGKEEKNIQIIGVPKNAGQVKLAGSIIRDLSRAKFNPDSTAIVLNNEALSIPMLNSLPSEIPDFNFTMGLPLKETSLYKLVNRIVTMNDNATKFNTKNEDGLKFYHVDVSLVLEHPYIVDIIRFLEGNHVSQLQLKLVAKSNKVFLNRQDIMNSCEINNMLTITFLDHLFLPWNNNPNKAIELFVMVIDTLKEYFTSAKEDSDKFKLELEYTFHFAKVFNKLQDIFTSHSFLDDLSSFRMVIQQIVQSMSIPFYGEPLKGIQVMGMLETRMLDFENLVMLSVNEDFIPAGKSSQSFISFDIRQEFKLPTYTEKNAVFAYHFYRLLQRAKNVYLIYNTEADDLGGGDKSRFLTQLINEFPKYNSKLKFSEQILTIPPGKINVNPIVIPKNESILERLDELAKKGFSASSMNVFRSCSLRFYFQYIKRIQETEEIEETIEAATLGTVIHSVLQNLYQPYVKKILTKEILIDLKAKAPVFIKKSFSENFKDGDIDHGKNLLITRVAESYINKFLQKEINYLADLNATGQQLTVQSVEGEYAKDIVLKNSPDQKRIKLKGIIDRIDRVGAVVRIIDYKTGKVEPRELAFKDWTDFDDKPRLDKCFQLLFYSYLFQQEKHSSDEVQAGIISFRNMMGGFMQLKHPNSGDDVNSDFEVLLENLFDKIYNPELPYTQTKEESNCLYCPYAQICNR